MQKITPFLWFDKECEEAMNFYVDIFASSPVKNGESKIESIKYYPEHSDNEHLKNMQGKVLTGVFMLAGQQFMALDGGPIFKPSTATSMSIDCSTQEEVDHFWTRLGAGGAPEAQQCGWLADKYGFAWQVVPKQLPELLSQPDQEKANRVMQAMMQMKKIVIADLEKAAE